MYLHIFLFRWKADATAQHRERAARDIQAFLGAVPGLVTLSVGDNLAANNGGFEFGGCLGFADEAAYRAYCDHPLHIELLDWLVPLIDAIELDLKAD
jgi:Stress responsive A/B Barrel Domain